MFTLRILGVGFSLVSILLIFEFIRRKRIKEKYALIWFFVLFSLIAICIKFPLIEHLGRLIGIATPSNMLFFLGITFCFILIFSLTVIVSVMSNRMRILAQKIAFLEFELKEIQDRKE